MKNKNDISLDDIEAIFSHREHAVIGKYSRYSVLVPLIARDGRPHILFEIRSDNLRRQPGEVCFPGGKIEDGEGKEACALRETAEELGIPETSIRIISQIDTLHTYSNFTMYSFLGVIDDEELKNANINHNEVKSIFLVPFSKLLEQEPYIYKMDIIPNIRDDFPYNLVNFSNGYNWRTGESEVPIYKFGDVVIWGLTARITHNLVRIIQERK